MAFPAVATNGQIYNTADGRQYKYVLADDSWVFQSVQNSAPKTNGAATAPPTAAADISGGYGIGSIWVDVLGNKAFIAVDVTAGAAIWVESTPNAKVQAVAPTTPLMGEQYLNTTDGFYYIWNGTAWVDTTAAGSGIKNNFVAVAAPIATNDSGQGYTVGSVWIDTVANTIYTLVDSTLTNAIWTLGGGSGIIAATVAPAPAAIGMLWYDTANKQLMAHNGVAWVSQEATNNYASIVAPALTNDSSQGYAIGSIWIDTLANKSYTAVDVTIGAAIWSSGGGAAATVAAVAPLTPATGDIWMDTATDITYLWNGVAWIDITAAAGGTASAAVVSAVAPLTPATGDIWMDTATDITYLWNGVAWIDITAAGAGSGALQAWVDVTATRAIGTVYTNVTGSPIQVLLSLSVATTISVAGVVIGSGVNLTATIPNNTTYTTLGGTVTSWAELR